MIGRSFVANFGLLAFGPLTGQIIWYLAVAGFMGVIGVIRAFGILIDGYHKALLVRLIAEVTFTLVLLVADNKTGTGRGIPAAKSL